MELGMGTTDRKILFCHGIQREGRKINFQWESTTTGRFMTAWIITFQMIVVSQILIYLTLPLIIEPARIKYPVIPLLCLQLPYMLPLKTLLVLWPLLMIFHDSLSYLLMILTLPMARIKTSLTVAGCTKDTAPVSTIKEYATKKTRFYCSTWSDKYKRLY